MTGKPQYARLHETIKKQIQKGLFQEGDTLPSENEMCNTYQLARSTVRQALDALVKEGYIKKIKGKGSVVSSPVRSLGLLSFRGFSDVLEKTQQQVQTKFINKPYVTTWNDDFFFNLSKQEIEAGCVALERLRYADKHPVMWEFTYLPHAMLPGLTENPFVNNSLFQTLSRNYQVEIINLEQDLKAISATREAAERLETKKGSPIIHMYRKYLTNRRELNIYSSLYCNTEIYALANHIS